MTPFAVLSLAKICYMSCNNHERTMFGGNDGLPHMNVASCCERLFGCGKEFIPQSVGHTAAKNGHVDCLDAARRLGCQLDLRTAKYAVSRNRFDTVVWMHRNGFAWDLEFTRVVVSHGAIRLLQYGYEHGCPWDGTVAQAAMKFNQRDCLQFLHDHGCPCDETFIDKLHYQSKLRSAKRVTT